jgi:hypothetical protein
MEAVLQGVGLIAFAVSATWGISLLAGRLVAKRGFGFWAWDRVGAISRVLVLVGFGMAAVGLTQLGTPLGSTLLLVGSLLGLVGIWLLWT